ncbi:hypothetical protein ACIBF6_13160 [Streptosporangium amethystogenes]|uniref:hypothetical protein n=1 Tax=Streptosporangium amethystogenes TaxID=2002 RepID=UPI0037B77977
MSVTAAYLEWAEHLSRMERPEEIIALLIGHLNGLRTHHPQTKGAAAAKGSSAHNDLLAIGQERKKHQPALMELRQRGATAAELAIGNMFDHGKVLRRSLVSCT